jgi:hypothetical protein
MFLALVVPASAAATPRLRAAPAVPAAGNGAVSPAAPQALSGDYLVPDVASLEPTSDALAPTSPRGWLGIWDPNSAPSDSTSAVGATRYVELVNRKYAIYDKTSNAPLHAGTLNTLFGAGPSVSTHTPQIIWDPSTRRFYYAGVTRADASHNELAVGFSKTATPTNGTTDWCKYFLFGYGEEIPDSPRLGDTANFAVIGVNVIGANGITYLRSDMVAMSKPAGGNQCPAPTTFKLGGAASIKNADGTSARSPLPINQMDSSSTGYALAPQVHTSSASKLSLFRIRRNADGTPNVDFTGSDVPVPSYSVPDDAPQPGTTRTLPTGDARLTQGVSAIDPVHSNAVGIWTQHTVNGGAGARVRWYEINPVRRTLIQTGVAQHASMFMFNGAISPNRVVDGATRAFGGSMVLQLNTSSSATLPAIRAVSKVGVAAQSASRLLKGSPAPLDDFTCTTGRCRWSGYASATPDPTPPPGTSRIWTVNQYSVSAGTGAGWRTWNSIVVP